MYAQAHLDLANRHLAEAAARISAQRVLIGELERDGHPTGAARELLLVFMATERAMRDHRDLIAEELRAGR